jgi:hypothetical protein
MILRRRSRPAGAGLVVCASLLLAGCSPIPVGLTAVSQRDGHLLVAVMRCDDTALERISVEHGGPLKVDEPREYIEDGRWATDRDDDDVIVLDTSAVGEGWTTKEPLGQLDPEIAYSVSAGGGFDDPMGSVGFTADEIATLDEGQWLYEDGDPRQDGAVRPTTTDLAELRERECDT